jgi:exopolyphosphatase/guanosine-5'-triphosphate,3'-diphosphate pyrophosphatase
VARTEAERPVAVLDVGSFSARLVAVRPSEPQLQPVVTHKTRLRLDRALDRKGRLSREGVDSVVDGVRSAMRVARSHGIEDVFTLGTSSIRDARNVTEVVHAVRGATGSELRFLSGTREAELSFLAARRWYGERADPLLVLDIGGGTVELAAGRGRHAEFARSLDLGARTMTRAWFADGPADEVRIEELRAHVVERLHEAFAEVDVLRDHQAIGCSKVLRQLARLAGARPCRAGGQGGRDLLLADLREWIPRLAVLPPRRRAELPGISRCRASQALAGAVVAEALLTVAGGRAQICPWSTREGLLLTLMEQPESLSQDDRPAA